MAKLKLFMVLLGCKPPGRHIEQHDVFFGIGTNINGLAPAIKEYWPEGVVHIDAWREVNAVEGYQLTVTPKDSGNLNNENKLFFVNLGGYIENKFDEQHYVLLTVKPNKAAAFKEAKSTLFYQHEQIPGCHSHIDDSYGVDVDDLYQIEEMLSPELKEKYQINITPLEGLTDDPLHLGYINLVK